MAPYVGAPEIKARRLVLAVEYHGQIGNPGYAYDLRRPPAAVAPRLPVRFTFDTTEALPHLATGHPSLELGTRDLRELPQQQAEGEVCVGGWLDETLVFYGWLQFRARRLAGPTMLPIGSRRAFVYRCLTMAAHRGHRIYPGALAACQRWLRDRGYEQVFIEAAASNPRSRRGIERCRFARVGDYRVHRVLGRRWATYDSSLAALVAGRSPC